MELERQPPRADTQFLRRFLDPDRAEITERSNDVRPYEEHRFIVRLRRSHCPRIRAAFKPSPDRLTRAGEQTPAPVSTRGYWLMSSLNVDDATLPYDAVTVKAPEP